MAEDNSRVRSRLVPIFAEVTGLDAQPGIQGMNIFDLWQRVEENTTFVFYIRASILGSISFFITI